MPNSADINDGQTTAAVLFSPTESCAFSFPLFVFSILNLHFLCLYIFFSSVCFQHFQFSIGRGRTFPGIKKKALIATGSVDWNLGRFPLLNWACQLWPALPQGSWRSSALWQSLPCSTPTPPLGSDTKNQGCRFFLILNDLMRDTSWGGQSWGF